MSQLQFAQLWVCCGPTGGHDKECTVSINVQIGVEEQLSETLQRF